MALSTTQLIGFETELVDLHLACCANYPSQLRFKKTDVAMRRGNDSSLSKAKTTSSQWAFVPIHAINESRKAIVVLCQKKRKRESHQLLKFPYRKASSSLEMPLNGK
jgi:hypothetical protein